MKAVSGDSFSLRKAAENRAFIETVRNKYGNAGIYDYAGVSLVFLNPEQNAAQHEVQNQTVQIILQLMLVWNNRQISAPLGMTVVSHLRKNVEYYLQNLAYEGNTVYREVSSIWRELRVLDQKQRELSGKKRVKTKQNQLQKERKKWHTVLEQKLAEIKQEQEAPARREDIPGQGNASPRLKKLGNGERNAARRSGLLKNILQTPGRAILFTPEEATRTFYRANSVEEILERLESRRRQLKMTENTETVEVAKDTQTVKQTVNSTINSTVNSVNRIKAMEIAGAGLPAVRTRAPERNVLFPSQRAVRIFYRKDSVREILERLVHPERLEHQGRRRSIAENTETVEAAGHMQTVERTVNSVNTIRTTDITGTGLPGARNQMQEQPGRDVLFPSQRAVRTFYRKDSVREILERLERYQEHRHRTAEHINEKRQSRTDILERYIQHILLRQSKTEKFFEQRRQRQAALAESSRGNEETGRTKTMFSTVEEAVWVRAIRAEIAKIRREVAVESLLQPQLLISQTNPAKRITIARHIPYGGQIARITGAGAAQNNRLVFFSRNVKEDAGKEGESRRNAVQENRSNKSTAKRIITEATKRKEMIRTHDITRTQDIARTQDITRTQDIVRTQDIARTQNIIRNQDNITSQDIMTSQREQKSKHENQRNSLWPARERTVFLHRRQGQLYPIEKETLRSMLAREQSVSQGHKRAGDTRTTETPTRETQSGRKPSPERQSGQRRLPEERNISGGSPRLESMTRGRETAAALKTIEPGRLTLTSEKRQIRLTEKKILTWVKLQEKKLTEKLSQVTSYGKSSGVASQEKLPGAAAQERISDSGAWEKSSVVYRQGPVLFQHTNGLRVLSILSPFPGRRNPALLPENMEYLKPERGSRKQKEAAHTEETMQAEIQYLRKERNSREQVLQEQIRTVKALTHKVDLQEKLFAGLKEKQTAAPGLGKAEMKIVVKEVMEQLSKDLRLQQLRRGLR